LITNRIKNLKRRIDSGKKIRHIKNPDGSIVFKAKSRKRAKQLKKIEKLHRKKFNLKHNRH